MKKYFTFNFSDFIKTWSGKLVTLNVVIFTLMLVYNYFKERTWEFSENTFNIFGAIHPHQSSWYTVATMMFLHGGFAHIFCNSISLKSIGSNLEKHAGSWFLPVYLLSGVVSGIAVYMYGSDWTVGASGAICGIWAMLDVYNMKYLRSKFMLVAMAIDLALLIYISSLPKVSAIGHFAGFVTGLVFGLIYFTWFYLKPADEESEDEEPVEVIEEKETRLIITEAEYKKIIEEEKMMAK